MTASHGPVRPRGETRLRPVAPGHVTFDPAGFWGAIQRRNREVTIPHAEAWLERTGALDAFLPPAEREVRERRGALYSDSDVYKVLEAMAWEAAPDVRRRLERLCAIVARAREPDGYLHSYWGAHEGRERYGDLQDGHELYCAGHLVQASVAAARSGGPALLVELGRSVADHACREFGPDGPRPRFDGHPELETALAELYRETGERRYLDTARAMIDRRGHGGAAYYLDDVPVRDAEVMRGHAVRALYLLAGAVDVATETGDAALLAAVQRQWRATVARRTYITGGMGSRHQDEGFGEDFELSPDRAYAETCAGVAAVMLAWRLLLATGESHYADALERIVHNVVLASPSREGDAFFYPNPLQRRTASEAALRVPWFWCACCPPNVARLFASLGGYVATAGEDGVQLHLYAAGTVRAGVAELAVRTTYPWDGEIAVEVVETEAGPWTLSLRVPPWARGATVSVAGGAPELAGPGVVRLRRAWRRGDVVRLALPMAPRFTAPDPRIDAVRGCVAVERGPLVYCAEEPASGVDLARAAVVPASAQDVPAVDGLVGVIGVAVRALELPGDAAADWPYAAFEREPGRRDGDRTLTLVPYYAWANRGPSTMRVWLPTV